VREYLSAAPDPTRKTLDVLSSSDPTAAWTAKAHLQVQFTYGINYLIDKDNAIIVDVEATPARRGQMLSAWHQDQAAGRRHCLRRKHWPWIAGFGPKRCMSCAIGNSTALDLTLWIGEC
jgi:hypothetical protein